jgi:riboflavin synthase
MFTGIIEEIGTVGNVTKIQGGLKINLHASGFINEIKVNDSISVNGICLTVTDIKIPEFSVDAVGATITKTSIRNFESGTKVNLERAMRADSRFDGHFVQGHVNGIGIIEQIKKLGENYYVQVSIPEKLNKYFIEEGSVAIDGISLTIADKQNDLLGFSIIPHTWKKTNLQFRNKGEEVNIEVDMLAKYVENFLSPGKSKSDSKITENWLNELGY